MALYSTAVIAVLLGLQGVRGQDLSSTIVGCADVDCLDNPGSTSAKCTVVDKTFTAIGLARIPVTSDALSGLSWTQGVAATDSNGQRTFDKSFYFGTPPTTNLTGTGACGVFFRNISDSVSFGGNNIALAQGTCQDAMSTSCVNALIQRATSIETKGLEISEVCSNLGAAFNENLDSACEKFAAGKSWSGISVEALSGPGAADAITAAENSTSNCWPILPKEDSLALTSSETSSGDFLLTTVEKNFNEITPILTLFFPGDGDLITKTEAQMTCMKTIGLSNAANGTQTTDGGDKGSDGAVHRVGVSSLVTALTFAFFMT